MMFKAIIERHHISHYTAGMTTKRWQDVPTAEIPIASLTATQPGILLHALLAETLPVGGDQYPHVIAAHGELFLEDGHHRVVRAIMAGETSIRVRVLTHANQTQE